MAVSFTGRKRVRKNFGKIPFVAEMPNLIEVQRASYDKFVKQGATEKERLASGLERVLQSIFPIQDFSNTSSLQYIKYTLDKPKYDVEECRQRGMTYAAPLRATLQLVVYDVDPDTEARSVLDIKEQDVYMGDLPMMTNNGTFIINGTERVVVSQMHRSRGYFSTTTGAKPTPRASFCSRLALSLTAAHGWILNSTARIWSLPVSTGAANFPLQPSFMRWA